MFYIKERWSSRERLGSIHDQNLGVAFLLGLFVGMRGRAVWGKTGVGTLTESVQGRPDASCRASLANQHEVSGGADCYDRLGKGWIESFPKGGCLADPSSVVSQSQPKLDEACLCHEIKGKYEEWSRNIARMVDNEIRRCKVTSRYLVKSTDMYSHRSV